MALDAWGGDYVLATYTSIWSNYIPYSAFFRLINELRVSFFFFWKNTVSWKCM